MRKLATRCNSSFSSSLGISACLRPSILSASSSSSGLEIFSSESACSGSFCFHSKMAFLAVVVDSGDNNIICQILINTMLTAMTENPNKIQTTGPPISSNCCNNFKKDGVSTSFITQQTPDRRHSSYQHRQVPLIKTALMIIVIIKLCKEIFDPARYFYCSIKWIAFRSNDSPICSPRCN